MWNFNEGPLIVAAIIVACLLVAGGAAIGALAF